MRIVGLKLCVKVLQLINFVDKRVEADSIMSVIVEEVKLDQILTLLKACHIDNYSTIFLEITWVLSFGYLLAIYRIVCYFGP